MIIKLHPSISDDERDRLLLAMKTEGLGGDRIPRGDGELILASGRPGLNLAPLQAMPGVVEIVPDKSSFKLVARDQHPDNTIVHVGPVAIGGERIAVTAGPCAIESEEQALTIARAVKQFGAVIFRGGAFKPRSSPYSFQGLGEEGLRILALIRQETGLPVVSEITSTSQAEMMAQYLDMVQVGARNMQNFELLKCVGRMRLPVLLKRGLAATIEEWLMSAEYIMSEGNTQVVICERGIRTFEPYTRNTLDLSAIPVVRNLTHLPIVIDPSHATGIREKVAPMARAAIAAGADGLLIEVHNDPSRALSDGAQSLFPEQFGRLMRDLYVIAPVIDKQVDFGYIAKAATVKSQEADRKSDGPAVAFQGELGVADHKACRHYFGDKVHPIPTPSYRGIFERVANKELDYGLIPLEHSMTGSVHENYDLLLEYDLNIVGELTLRIDYSLVTLPGTGIAAIERVVSSPTVFHQCEQFVDSHRSWERISAQDVATAAAQVREQNVPSLAAITTPEAADLHGLEIVESGVETNPRNYTRFVIVAREPSEHGERTKSSIIYQTADRPGALLETLTVFANNGINLVKLESRPASGRPWEYMFYVDVAADALSGDFQPVIDELRKHTDYLKLLGAY